MRTENGYRYNLHFPADTEEKIRVGEFLESCGHKKSTIVVEALSAYMDTNPELPKQLAEGGNVSVVVKRSLTRADIEALVYEMIRKAGNISPAAGLEEAKDGIKGEAVQDEHVTRMIDSLTELFD